MTINRCIKKLTFYVNELLNLEEDETFDPSDLQEWIDMLKKGDLRCPCKALSFELNNCLFYDYINCEDCNVCENCELEEDCDFDHEPSACMRYCDDCYGYSDCGDCPRSDTWFEIQRSYIGLKMGEKLANWFIGQIVAKELEKLL